MSADKNEIAGYDYTEEPTEGEPPFFPVADPDSDDSTQPDWDAEPVDETQAADAETDEVF